MPLLLRSNSRKRSYVSYKVRPHPPAEWPPTDGSVDASDKSAEWEAALSKEPLADYIRDQAVAIKLQAGSSEAGFLTPICPINNIPAVVVIKNAALQANIQAEEDTDATLVEKLKQLFGAPEADQTSTSPAPVQPAEPSEPVAHQATSASTGPSLGYIDLPSSAGQPRLPNNAYDALREYTEGLKESGQSPGKIRDAQLDVLSRLPIFKDEVRRLRTLAPNTPLELSQTARDRLMLRLPAAAIKAQVKVQSNATGQAATETMPVSGRVYPPQSVGSQRTNQRPAQPPAAPVAPVVPEVPELSAAQRAQQNEYRQMQRDREQKQREERERVKAQIKADKEERRRREQVQKHNEAAASASASGTTKPRGSELRVQVRTFDGSVIRETFKPTSTITNDVRPWIDSTIEANVPYDFKLILNPEPNKKIEAAEEELPLSDLGIRSSCTFVIAPVTGYVESYSGASGGIVGSAISGGYNLVAGTAGALFGGVRSVLGYGQPASETTSSQGQTPAGDAASQRSMRVRTLADQRAEEAGKNQFYNGNQLNFEPNKDDDRKND